MKAETSRKGYVYIFSSSLSLLRTLAWRLELQKWEQGTRRRAGEEEGVGGQGKAASHMKHIAKGRTNIQGGAGEGKERDEGGRKPIRSGPTRGSFPRPSVPCRSHG